jgi:tetratricopeptide (TPR) repeat protein
MAKGPSGFDHERPMPRRRRVFFSALILALLVLAVYYNSLHCSFHLDDFHSITQNPNIHMKDMTWAGITKSLHSDLNYPEKLYRPVAGLTFALNFFVSGTDPFSYHLVNVLIHWLSSVFLLLFLYQTLQLPSFHRKYASSAYSIALLSAALWAINPVQTQSVTYIVQRINALAGMFYILSMACYVTARTAPDRKGGFLYWVLCLAAFVLAFGSKENAALLPVSVLLYEGMVVQADIGSWIGRNKVSLLTALSLILILGILYVNYRRGSLLSFMNDYEERPFTLGQRLLTQPRVILFYLSLVFYPIPSRLSLAHSLEVSTSLFNPLSTFVAILTLAGAVVLSLRFSNKLRIPSFCFLFFLVNHLLESSVFPLELVFEHRNYIPSMVLFLPVAVGICLLFERYEKRPAMKGILAAFVGLLLVGLGHATYLRNSAWKSEQTLWADASLKAPDQFRPHHNLGVSYQQQGRVDEAIAEFEKALGSKGLNRKKEQVVTYYHLGRAYAQLGDHAKSKEFYNQALQMDGNLPQALADLAVLYGAEGDESNAWTYLKRALKVDPGNPYVNFNMGLHFMKQRETDRAEPHFIRALQTEALQGSAHLYLGMIYKQRKELGRAEMHLKDSAAANPKDLTPLLHLLEVYHAAGLEEKTLQEGEVLAERVGSDQDLFRQTVDLILTKGSAGDVLLSGDIIFPVLYQVMSNRGDVFESQLIYLKRLLDKDSEIE